MTRRSLGSDEAWALVNQRLHARRWCEKVSIRSSPAGGYVITGKVAQGHPCFDAIREIINELHTTFDLPDEVLRWSPTTI